MLILCYWHLNFAASFVALLSLWYGRFSPRRIYILPYNRHTFNPLPISYIPQPRIPDYFFCETTRRVRATGDADYLHFLYLLLDCQAIYDTCVTPRYASALGGIGGGSNYCHQNPWSITMCTALYNLVPFSSALLVLSSCMAFLIVCTVKIRVTHRHVRVQYLNYIA